MLFRKKEEKRVIELTAAEVRLLREGLMCFHNKCCMTASLRRILRICSKK